MKDNIAEPKNFTDQRLNIPVLNLTQLKGKLCIWNKKIIIKKSHFF